MNERLNIKHNLYILQFTTMNEIIHKKNILTFLYSIEAITRLSKSIPDSWKPD